jgi:membrane-associated protease RseP (regulator of RpoE activity)
MSNSKTAIGEIKKLMVQFGFMTEESTPLSFKLQDNTILQTAKLEAGNKIVKINEEFERVALEDGFYRLVENFSIKVKDGEIKSVRQIFVDAKLIDGTVVKVEGDAVIEGAKVVVVTADAEIPAPDGVHELEDGTKIETKDGIIVAVTEAMGEDIPGQAKDVKELMEEAPAVAPEMEEPEVEIEVGMSKEMMDMLKEFISKMGEKMAKMEKSYSDLENEFNAFKKQPGAKKIADGKTQKFNSANDSSEALESKIASIMALRNK